MTITSKFFVVAYKDKIASQSKVFRVKQQARVYAGELQSLTVPKTHKQNGDAVWSVKEIEAVLD